MKIELSELRFGVTRGRPKLKCTWFKQNLTTLAKRRQTNRVHPEQPLDTELGDLGIKQKYIENEEEQWKALITIKSLPVSMTQKRNIK
jgi:hypothetical protein